MEFLIDTKRIELDYEENREDNDIGQYRLTLNDKYGHYYMQVFLDTEQIRDLIDGLIPLDKQIPKNEY